MDVALYFIKEIAMIIFYLSLPVFLIYTLFTINKDRKEYNNLISDVVDEVLEKASDDKPIVFNVSQHRLIDRVIEELEKKVNVLVL